MMAEATGNYVSLVGDSDFEDEISNTEESLSCDNEARDNKLIEGCDNEARDNELIEGCRVYCRYTNGQQYWASITKVTTKSSRLRYSVSLRVACFHCFLPAQRKMNSHSCSNFRFVLQVLFEADGKTLDNVEEIDLKTEEWYKKNVGTPPPPPFKRERKTTTRFSPDFDSSYKRRRLIFDSDDEEEGSEDDDNKNFYETGSATPPSPSPEANEDSGDDDSKFFDSSHDDDNHDDDEESTGSPEETITKVANVDNKKNVGSRVYTICPINNEWYWGTVTKKSVFDGSCIYSVKYDDGDASTGLTEDYVWSIDAYQKKFKKGPPPLPPPPPPQASDDDSDSEDDSKLFDASDDDGDGGDNNDNDEGSKCEQQEASEEKKKIGSRVYSRYCKGGWYWGRIVKIYYQKNGSTFYSVSYDDGDYKDAIEKHNVLSEAEYKSKYNKEPPPPQVFGASCAGEESEDEGEPTGPSNGGWGVASRSSIASGWGAARNESSNGGWGVASRSSIASGWGAASASSSSHWGTPTTQRLTNAQLGNTNCVVRSRDPYLSHPEIPPTRSKRDLPPEALSSAPRIKVLRDDYDQHYLGKKFAPGRVIIKEENLSTSMALEKQFKDKGTTYQLICTKLEATKNKWGAGRPDRSPNYVKAFYVATSGPGLRRINIQDRLEKIGDFASLCPGKAAARLELLVSPARSSWTKGRKNPHMFRFRSDEFEVIEENGHNGCGFIPKDRLKGLLGDEASSAVQVRLISSSLGIFKGMLMSKTGVEKIQLPTSMRKVKPSKTRPKSKEESVFLLFNGVFPSKKSKMMERQLHPDTKDPPPSSNENLLGLSKMTQLVMLCNGVSLNTLDDYLNQSSCYEGRKHESCVGVADPTDALPEGHVFATGLRFKNANNLNQVFVTRVPCTERDNGKLLPVVTKKPSRMSDENWKFLCSIQFGLLIFATPPRGHKSIPETISNGDLDGDTFCVCWDDTIVQEIRSSASSLPPAPDAELEGGNDISETETVTETGWFSKVQDHLADTKRLYEMKMLKGALHGAWKLRIKNADLDINDSDTVILGRAFQESLDIEKHGGRVSLPLHLRHYIKNKKLHKHLDM